MKKMTCKHCGLEKPVDEFRRDSRRPSGYRPQCKACKRQYETSRQETTVDPTSQLVRQPATKHSQVVDQPVSVSSTETVNTNVTETDQERETRLAQRRERDRLRRERNSAVRAAQKAQEATQAAEKARVEARTRQARVNAIKRLVLQHEREYKRLFKEERQRLAVPMQQVWTPLVDMSEPEAEVEQYAATGMIMEAV
jgi:hypothetical protein